MSIKSTGAVSFFSQMKSDNDKLSKGDKKSTFIQVMSANQTTNKYIHRKDSADDVAAVFLNKKGA